MIVKGTVEITADIANTDCVTIYREIGTQAVFVTCKRVEGTGRSLRMFNDSKISKTVDEYIGQVTFY